VCRIFPEEFRFQGDTSDSTNQANGKKDERCFQGQKIDTLQFLDIWDYADDFGNLFLFQTTATEQVNISGYHRQKNHRST